MKGRAKRREAVAVASDKMHMNDLRREASILAEEFRMADTPNPYHMFLHILKVCEKEKQKARQEVLEELLRRAKAVKINDFMRFGSQGVVIFNNDLIYYLEEELKRKPPASKKQGRRKA